MTDGVRREDRDAWRGWAQQTFGPDDDTVSLATDTVLRALIEGYDVPDAMELTRNTVAAAGNRASGEGIVTSDRRHLRGVVAAYRDRPELIGRQWGTVVDFRVDHWNRDRTPAEPVPVEMRGLRLEGSVNDGDWVEISGKWKPGRIMHPSRLLNRTLNEDVVVHGSGGGVAGQLWAVISFIVRFAVAVAALGLIAGAGFIGLQIAGWQP